MGGHLLATYLIQLFTTSFESTGDGICGLVTRSVSVLDMFVRRHRKHGFSICRSVCSWSALHLVSPASGIRGLAIIATGTTKIIEELYSLTDDLTDLTSA